MPIKISLGFSSVCAIIGAVTLWLANPQIGGRSNPLRKPPDKAMNKPVMLVNTLEKEFFRLDKNNSTI